MTHADVSAVPRPQYPGTQPSVPVRFMLGERVRVRETAPLGHIRTPYYIRGHVGVIERLCGSFRNPEELAQMRDGLPAQPLYRVRFVLTGLWSGYQGGAQDTIDIEIFQHWLEPASDAARARDMPRKRAARRR